MKFSKKQIECLKELAAVLVDDGENVEYTRGICELIAEIDAVTDVDHGERSEEIRHEILNMNTPDSIYNKCIEKYNKVI